MRVHRVVSALDSGYVVNPLSVEMQTQGAIVYALTAALYGEITIKNGAAEQANFDTYEMLRMAGRRVVTVIVPSGDFWGGVGEPPCRRWRRLCATRSSPPPASASAPCR